MSQFHTVQIGLANNKINVAQILGGLGNLMATINFYLVS